MSKTMLIDAANAEEIRVCLLQNGKVEDFDFESASRKPLRGNIYLARVTRVEPSLQAAFVEFGGNRHGFLAFNEIHPDYYQIPVSDRKVLQEAEAEEAAIAAALNIADGADDDDRDLDEIAADITAEQPNAIDEAAELDSAAPETDDPAEADESELLDAAETEEFSQAPAEGEHDEDSPDVALAGDMESELPHAGTGEEDFREAEGAEDPASEDDESDEDSDEPISVRERTPLEMELAKLTRPQLIERYREARRKRARLLRNYKIQEVVKRRQILLVQAVKEERGNKGAALTTYLSLAGRYCVLMPNTARGGGISRKIPVAADRKRLRRVVDSLDVPSGMGLIIRTAGAKRTKAEIKRDYEYLVRLWENIRTLTLKSIAPCLIYEEASLIKRAIRDLYDKDIDSVLVDGDAGYREAKDFMKMLMPSHAKNVQPYKEKTPLFLKHGVESQLDAMYRPTVRLKSGGYIVINQTEALIAIDVNSGKSTRERNIEQTALRTNLEAADEVARQCRLRDLAGLIVIDFIDMEEGRNNRAVEKRLKDALRADRARLQIGRISAFGLLELSRQRRRSGIVDGTTHQCPTCGGAGAVRSHEMAALRILRAAETEAIASKAGNLQIRAALEVALYILNHKRAWLARLETDYGLRIELLADPAKAGDNFEIEKSGVRSETVAPTIVRADTTETIEPENEADDAISAEPEEANEAEESEQEEQSGRRRRRRRRRRREEAPTDKELARNEDGHVAEGVSESQDGSESRDEDSEQTEGDDRGPRRRRRGRRGGRRGRRSQEGQRETSMNSSEDDGEVEQPYIEDRAPAADEAQAEIALAQAPVAESSEQAAHEARSDQPSETQAAARASEEPAPGKPAETFVEPPKPTRRGWWNKALGG